MGNFKNLTVKQQFVLALVGLILLSSALTGVLAYNQSRQLVVTRMLQHEMPSVLRQVSLTLEGQINQMTAATQQLAENPYILRWAEAGYPADEEALLLTQIRNVKQQLQLDAASWADRQSARYWNQDGFLRTLNHEQDGWFYAFRDSNQPTNVSLFTEPNGITRMFVNYQQVNGRGLSGIALSLQQLVTFLRNVRIAETGLVYIADSAGNVIIHPDAKQIGGQTLLQRYGADVAGKLINSKSLVTETTEQQLLVSVPVQGTSWSVVAQVPLPEVLAPVETLRNTLLLAGLAAVVIAGVLAWILASSLTRRLHSVAETLVSIGDGEGDLRQRLPADGALEMRQIGSGFNNFVDKIHRLVTQLHNQSEELQSSASKVDTSAAKNSDLASEQRDRLSGIATAIEQLSNTIGAVAANASRAADTADHTNQNASRGLEVIGTTSDSLQKLTLQVDNIAAAVGALAANSDKIGSILSVIRAISEQTNLLALNAAIEAARAGEQGRGFAVVADEVRQLAQRAASATDEIQQMIDQLQSESQSAVLIAQDGKQKASDSAKSMQLATAELQHIVDGIKQLDQLNREVATATDEQASVVQHLGESVHSVAHLVDDSAESAASLAGFSVRLRQLSTELNGLIDRFVV
ncbi:methyl-accepting chemotaxis protein [Rheinheimera baltica]|uniref:Methyl-accepting chemotaxis protein n=1 Tax=Rheinheimera baltica TaxID=67576 RepID=A0ABT9I3S4_9GAMM|nr:methyl-accepting chemotaxis protein [Rheinheimera baltica]MDP5138038.1 methyl-accepting chemotaxis protein [Rheinheimera baltica]